MALVSFPGAELDPKAKFDPAYQKRWGITSKKAHDLGRKEAKGPGDARMPVAITSRVDSGSTTFTDTAIYDVGYKESGGGLFGGTDVALRGISLVEHVSPAKAQARLDALWNARGK